MFSNVMQKVSAGAFHTDVAERKSTLKIYPEQVKNPKRVFRSYCPRRSYSFGLF